MRITRGQLKAIIVEEVRRALRESMMSDEISPGMYDMAFDERGELYDNLAAALIDAGAEDIITAMDIIADLESTASMGPLGAAAIDRVADSPGGELEAAFDEVVRVYHQVDERELASAMGRLIAAY